MTSGAWFDRGCRGLVLAAVAVAAAVAVTKKNGTAMLKLGNGRKANVLLSSLSEADQAYVKTRHEENKNKISENDLELTIKKKTK